MARAGTRGASGARTLPVAGDLERPQSIGYKKSSASFKSDNCACGRCCCCRETGLKERCSHEVRSARERMKPVAGATIIQLVQ